MSLEDDKHTPHIVDVRIRHFDRDYNSEDDSSNGTQLGQQIVSGLSNPVGEKTVPTMLLYDERGLRLYDRLTLECPEYYLFPAEEAILRTCAREIVEVMCSRDVETDAVTPSPVVLELGAG